MKTSKIITEVLALTLTCSAFVSCGKTDESSQPQCGNDIAYETATGSQSTPSTTAPIKTVEGNLNALESTTEAPTATETQPTTNNATSQGDFTKEDAIALIDNFCTAFKNKDVDGIIRYENIAMYGIGEVSSDEQLRAVIEEQLENGEFDNNMPDVDDYGGGFENFDFHAVEYDKAQSMNEAISWYLSETTSSTVSIDDFNNSYGLYMTEDMLNAKDDDYGIIGAVMNIYKEYPIVTFVNVGGEWKVDPAITGIVAVKSMTESLNEE